MDKEILNIIRRLIASGYSKKVRDEAVEKAKALGADCDTLDMIRNVIPLGE